jgi:hypothetical protein|tara:strand:+ start:70 stop:963 length:894 start_codon:yes stop_codon:yes gene_type:complete
MLLPKEKETMEYYNPYFEKDVVDSLEMFYSLDETTMLNLVHACEVAEYGEMRVCYYDSQYEFLSDMPEDHTLRFAMEIVNASIIGRMTEPNSGLTEDVANIFAGYIPKMNRPHGFDGFRFNGSNSVIWGEQKPKKYNGHGKLPPLASSINDYTPKRYVKDKYMANQNRYYFYFSYHDDKGKLLLVLGINAKSLLPLMKRTIEEDYNNKDINRVCVPVAWTDLQENESEAFLAWMDPSIDNYKDIIPGGKEYGKRNKDGSLNKNSEKGLFAFLKRLEKKFEGNTQDISGNLYKALTSK